MISIKRIVQKFRESENPYRFLLSKLLLLLNVNFYFVKVRIGQSQKIYLHASKWSVLLFLDKNFKRKEFNFYDRFLKSGDILVDVGANIGAFSLVVANKVMPNGKVYSIEANPKVYKYLIENISLNEMNDIVIPFNHALGDSEGIVEFYINKYGDDLGSLSSLNPNVKDVQKISMVRGDKLFGDDNIITLLKIDVEGAEYMVLNGFSSDLKNVKFILFEYEKKLLEAFNTKLADIFSLLAKYDFKIYRIKNNCIIELEKHFVSENGEDLFALRMSDLDEFKKRSGFN